MPAPSRPSCRAGCTKPRARLDRILADDPRDIVALQVGHLLDFYRGDSRNLRDRVGRVLPEWSPDLPGYHAVLGMYAFGLEESPITGAPSGTAASAVALNPHDGWAHHAVAHVMEMKGRAADGIGWLDDGSAPLGAGHLLRGPQLVAPRAVPARAGRRRRGARALRRAVHGGRSSVVLDMIDASALLWRLHLAASMSARAGRRSPTPGRRA